MSTSISRSLSRRGRELAGSPPMPQYLMEHFSRLAAPPANGYTPLCIAENRLVWDLLRDKFQGPFETPHSALCYDQMTGSETLRRRLAEFMGEHILGRHPEPSQLAVLAGAGSVLEILFYNLADAGDAVLVPTPSYAGFWLDLETRDGLRIVPVHCRSDDGFRLGPELLDAAVEVSERPVRALLFTSPNNPLGRVYTPAQVEEVLRWAEQARVHVVFDEIYALSVFGETPFTSCAALRPELGEWVHVVWAFSKDFGASGLRCGVLVSENRELMAAVDALSYWSACSGHTQHLLAELLADETWVADYIPTMRRRLGRAHDQVCASLQRQGIPHLPAEAGFFLLVDVRPFMAAISWEEEHRIWRRLLEEAGANLTPGAACHNGEPGFLRLCFASVTPEEAAAAVARMGRVLNTPSQR